jgi:diaminopimelate decarboxylase
VHVPALLAQEGLQCIQWVPAPEVSALRHSSMLREIQEAGVCVTFFVSPEEVEQACKEFDPRRLFLYTACESEAQARELVENTLRWCE